MQRPRPAAGTAAFPEQRTGDSVEEEIDAPPPRPPRTGKKAAAPKTIDLRPYLEALTVHDRALEITLRVTPTGTARADEILDLLGLADLLDAGTVLERTALDLEDDLPVQPPGDRAASPDPAAPHLTNKCGPPTPRAFTPSVPIREGNA